uniref:Uncharacterized protein n=1 Tax=Strongyloides venezuelensis TaxID=75913 RepID=A0A0K0FZT0_STRVS
MNNNLLTPWMPVRILIGQLNSGSEKKEPLRIDNIFDVCGSDLCRINNSKDPDFKPFPAEVMYNRVANKARNCEYSCLYGVSISKQANVGKAVVAVVKTLFTPNMLLKALATGILEFVPLEFNAVSKKHS